MGRVLDEWMARGYAQYVATGRLPRGRNPLKSYLIESNVFDTGDRQNDIGQFFTGDTIPVPVRLEHTEDSTLFEIEVGRDHVPFFLDTLDSRFWLLHTTAAAEAADTAVRSLIHRTPLLDSAWLPSRHLEEWAGELGFPRMLTAKFAVPTGLYQEDLLDESFLDESLLLRIGANVDARERWQTYRNTVALAPSLALWSARIVRREPDGDYVVVDDVTAGGKLTSRGNSFRLHQELVSGLRDRYAQVITDWEERYRLGWVASPAGARPNGSIAEFRLPESLEENEIHLLLSKMFNSGDPYRMYGVPVQQGGQRFVVRGVDLHTGDKIDFEITPAVIRAYLFPSTCGNVLARLLTNLQHYQDARIELP